MRHKLLALLSRHECKIFAAYTEEWVLFYYEKSIWETGCFERFEQIVFLG
jgi:hypothetical protein